MRCPLCDTENAGSYCTTCGKAFEGTDGSGDELAPIEGLLATQVAPPDLAVHVDPLPGLEHTQLESQMDVAQNWTAGNLPLERTNHDPSADVPARGGADPQLDLGRETDLGERTPAPAETAVCPYCGTPSLDAICDTCGRQKFRASPAPEAIAAVASGEITVCPSCFARVAKAVRCSDCGMPFPLQEL